MDDIFREVDEEYRHEQLLQFWHKNATLIILTLALAIGAAAGSGFWKSHHEAQQQQQTYTLTHAMGDASLQKPADALATLTKAAAEMTGHRIIPARFDVARATLTAGDTAAAIKLYDEIAADDTANSAERSLADISSIGIQIDSGDPKQLDARLDKLAADNNGFRFSARELQILLAMRQGDKQKAHDIATALANDKEAPDGVHTSAQQLAAVTGEGLALTDADTVPASEPPVEPPEAR